MTSPSALTYRVSDLREWQDHDHIGVGYTISRGEGHRATVAYLNVTLSIPDAYEVLAMLGLERGERSVVMGALATLALSRIEALLVLDDFDLAEAREAGKIEIRLAEEDLVTLVEILRDKDCSYQTTVGRDLFCHAVTTEDSTAFVGQTGVLQARTSRAICRGCNLPDDRDLCSHLRHPSVAGTPEGVRFVQAAVCDLNRPEIQDPAKCRTGGHGCWERLVEPRLASLEARLPETAILDALDHLDAAWRLAFGRRKRLIQLPTSRSVAELAMMSSTREDFRSRMSVLDDILKRMSVPDDILPEAERPLIRPEETFKRIGAALKAVLQDDSYADVESALDVLRPVNVIRVAQQHEARAIDAPGAFRALAISWPITSWSDAWDHVRARAVQALDLLRSKALEAVEAGNDE